MTIAEDARKAAHAEMADPDGHCVTVNFGVREIDGLVWVVFEELDLEDNTTHYDVHQYEGDGFSLYMAGCTVKPTNDHIRRMYKFDPDEDD